MILVNKPQIIPAQACPHHIAQFTAFLTIQINLALCRLFKQSGNLQHRRFSGTGRADKRHDFAFFNIKVNSSQNLQSLTALLKTAVNVSQFQSWRFFPTHNAKPPPDQILRHDMPDIKLLKMTAARKFPPPK